MRPCFDTSKEPCVPVYRDGSLEELSLRDTLVRAHEFQGVRHALPTVEFGLYRLLVALMGDIFFVEPGVTLNAKQLGDLMAKGHFEANRVDEYFAKYPRFDLFDEDKPFLQVGKMHEKEKPIASLLHPVPSGTNVNHFHHANEDNFAVSPKAALGLLSTVAPWMTSGGAGLTPSINDAPPIYVLVLGQNLFETLCLNFCVLPLRYARAEDDSPSWRWTRDVGGARNSSGYLESLTWMPRKVQLIPESGGACQLTGETSNVLVRQMYFVQGDSTKVEGKPQEGKKPKKKRLFTWIDPSVSYELTEDGPIPLRMTEGRELWRDVAALALVQGDSRFQRPRVIDQFEELTKVKAPDSESLRITLYGLRTDSKMKFFEWQRDTMALPRPLVSSSVFGYEVQNWMSQAEKVSNILARAVGYLHPKRYRVENKDAHKPLREQKFIPWEEFSSEKVRYENFKKRIRYVERRYWESLRTVFDKLLNELASFSEPTLEQRKPLRDKWRDALMKYARAGFDTAARGLDSKSHALERVARARRLLEFGLKRVFNPPSSDSKKADRPARKKGAKTE